MNRLTPTSAGRGFQILSWIGIISQLTTTRATRALAAIDLPFPQFVLLNHFSWRPLEPKTVTAVAHAMQQPQPGITKTIQKMVDAGLLRAQASKDDARSKLITLTPKGQKTHARAIQILTPAFQDAFAQWSEMEMAEFFIKLDKLKLWMDAQGRIMD